MPSIAACITPSDAAEAAITRAELAQEGANTPGRVYADFIWKDGKAVPDTVGMEAHPADFIHDPMRNDP